MKKALMILLLLFPLFTTSCFLLYGEDMGQPQTIFYFNNNDELYESINNGVFGYSDEKQEQYIYTIDLLNTNGDIYDVFYKTSTAGDNKLAEDLVLGHTFYHLRNQEQLSIVQIEYILEEVKYDLIDVEKLDIKLTNESYLTSLELLEYGDYQTNKIKTGYEATNSIYLNNINEELESIYLVRKFSVMLDGGSSIFEITLYYKVANNSEEYQTRIEKIENYDSLSLDEKLSCLLTQEEFLYEEEIINLCKENIKFILLPTKSN